MKKLTTEQFTKETKISRLSGSIDARMALQPKEIAVINSGMKSRSPVVYLLGHPTRASDGCFKSDQTLTSHGETCGSSTLTSHLWNKPLNRQTP